MLALRDPNFWWRRHSITGYALAPLGALYGRVAARRLAGPSTAVGVPVICIGNLVLGGAGKTPTALAVAGICRKLGLTPGFLSRGYRGTETGPISVSLALHSALDVGDEALLLARHGPTVVAVDRPSGAKLLASLGAEVVIMDDGFQNPSIEKDLSLVVVDGARGVGNGLVFPAGPLRAPLPDQMRRADALVVIGRGLGGAGVRIAARAGLPILRAHLQPTRRRGLKRRPYLAFAGIGHPAKFYAALEAAGAKVEVTLDFPDHHYFSDADCERIIGQAALRDLQPITTEKDRVRLVGRSGPAGQLAAATEVFPVRVAFEEPRRLDALIHEAVAGYRGVYRRTELTGKPAATVPA